MHTLLMSTRRRQPAAVLYIYFLTASWLIFGSTPSHSQLVSSQEFQEGEDFEFDSEGHSRSRRSPSDSQLFGESIIPDNYSIHELPPKEDGKPSQLHIALLIMNVRGVKEIDEEITLELNLQVYWQDTRLQYFASKIKGKFAVIKPVFLERMWHPDIFIDRLKSVQQPMLMSKPASLRIYPNSGVRYSGRMTFTMACQMDFHYYPADTQQCMIDIKSYAYMDTEILLAWKEKQGASFATQLNLPNFYVGMDTPTSFPLRTTSGSYSSLRFTVLLTRKLSYHLIQTYLPSCLLVMVSWLSFLVPPDSVPGRMAICMTCLLTLIAMFASVRQSTPNVSYVKAIDIWMVVCVFFVFLALAEFCIVLKFLSIRRKEKKEKEESSKGKEPPINEPAMGYTGGHRGSRGSIPTVYYSNTSGSLQRRLQSPRGSLHVAPEDQEMMEISSPPGDIPGPGRPPLPYPRPAAAPFQIFTQPPPLPEPPKPAIVHANKVKKIEFYTSMILPTLFCGFNFVYWPWLLASSQYYNQTHLGSTVIYSSDA